MKTHLTSFLALAAFSICPAVAEAQESDKPKTDPLAAYDSADALWAHVEKLSAGPATEPKSREEAVDYLKSVQAGAEAFISRYPGDPRQWKARIFKAMLGLQMQAVNGALPDIAATRAELKKIVSAQEAPEDARADAAMALIQLQTAMPSGNPADAAKAIEREVLAFQKAHPKDPRARGLDAVLGEAVEASDPKRAEALLRSAAKSGAPEFAQMAQTRLDRMELMRKPLEMSFTSVDGREVDVAKMRGKVVLVDFWATWCAPCVWAMPEIKAVYDKFHDQGFEIVGVSLDQDKEALEEFVKERELPWPNYFDVKGPENAMSVRYGITSIPAQWLLDKNGMIVATETRGDLAEQVEKLLADPAAAKP